MIEGLHLRDLQLARSERKMGGDSLQAFKRLPKRGSLVWASD